MITSEVLLGIIAVLLITSIIVSIKAISKRTVRGNSVEIENLQNKIAELNKDNGLLLKTAENYKELQDRFAHIEEEKNALHIENIRNKEILERQKDYEDIISQKDNYRLKLQSIEDKNNNLISEQERLQKELEQAKQDLSIKNKETQEQHKQLTEQASLLGSQKDYSEIKQELSSTKQDLQTIQLRLKAEEEKYKALQEKYNTYKKDFEELQKNFKNEIIKVTNEILKTKSEEFNKINKDSLKLILEPFEKEITSFKKSSKENLDDILKPFKTQIENFQKEIKENTTAQTKNEATFKNHIENMVKETNKISQEADNLVNALKGNRRNNKNIGTWGENTLENILAYSGLQKGISYETQENFSVTDEQGITRKQIPDFIVYIPTDKGANSECMVIDSKVSIEAYINYCNADTEEERKLALQAHIESIRRHIKGLSPKNYEKLPKVKNIDYIMMFIPIEPAYILAMDNAPDLWKEAYDKKILLMSPTNIIASLKLISLLWNINERNVNAENIGKLGKDLYEKLANFVEKFNKIGKSLDSAKQVFDDAQKNLTNERQGIIKKAEGFKQLGITPKKDIPKIEDNEVVQLEENV